MVAGIQIGKIDSVSVEDGHAVVGMDIEPKYAPLIPPDARLLLRPKTNLNDMVVEVDPGKRSGQLPDGSEIPLSRTQANVNPDEFLSTLDADTRQYLTLLLQGGSEGIGGTKKGLELSAGLRRLEPFARYTAQFAGALAKRPGGARARSCTTSGSSRTSSAAATTRSRASSTRQARRSAASPTSSRQLREALRELPPTLDETRRSLTSASALSDADHPTLTALTPQAQALGPALRSTGRPRAPPPTRCAPSCARSPPRSGPDPSRHPGGRPAEHHGEEVGGRRWGPQLRLQRAAYNPGARKPGYLFYLPWLNHDLNATYQLGDATGPLRRGILLLSCNSASLAGGFVLTRPYLHTIFQATNVPTGKEIC